jgi:UDP-2-acetamido-3-amino-2,3-dideoxy-glucuronate N-acetyltransferase
MDKNIAVIGGGYWGKNLVRNFAELGALHTICDSSGEVLEQLGAVYPDVFRETSYQSVLDNGEVKGVVLAVPAALHHSMARQALLAGKDVFVEKPLALRVGDGEELVRLAEENKRILMVGHVLEYHPGVIKLKELVDTGALGKINYIYSSRLNLGKFRTEENILWSFAPHDISVILLLLGDMPRQVSAHGGYYLHQDVADVTVTTMSFAHGAEAHIFVSWLHPYKEQKLVVIGEQKMALFDDVAPQDKLLIYEHQVEWIKNMPVPQKGASRPVEFTMSEPLRLECEQFIDCLLSRQRPKTDGANGLRVLRILEACQESLQGKGKVTTLGNERGYFVHETSIVEEPANIGNDTRIWHFSHIMPHVSIGRNCTLGQNVFVGENITIGDNVKIENNVSIFEGTILEDNVFCGPSCVFTNIKTPRSHVSRKGKYVKTLVKEGASIGANATVVCGNTIGKYCLVGAGAVVTRDLPDHAMVYGNPAKIQGWACQCGIPLTFDRNAEAECPECGKEYRRVSNSQIILCHDEKR